MRNGKWRVANYSPEMVGFGRIRRNASIAQALRRSVLQPVIEMIAEVREAGALPMPEEVVSVTLSSPHKEGNGRGPCFLDVSKHDLIALRAKVFLRVRIKGFKPDVLSVACLPPRAAAELSRALEHIRKDGETRCVLGLGGVPECVLRVENGHRPSRLDVAEILSESARLIHLANHGIVLGGHNTVFEVLSVQNLVTPDLTGASGAVLHSCPWALEQINGELFVAPRVRLARVDKELVSRPFTLSTELLERHCGEAFGSDLFRAVVQETLVSLLRMHWDQEPAGAVGRDVLIAPLAGFNGGALGQTRPTLRFVKNGDRTYEVDTSSVAGFKDVPKVPGRLAQPIDATVKRVLNGAPRLPRMPNDAPTPDSDPLPVQSAVARSLQNVTFPGHVTPSTDSTWEGSTELPVHTPGASSLAVPAPVRYVRAKGVAFRGLHAGDEDRFRLEERTIEFDDGTSSRDYIWVRGQYVLVVAVSGKRVVFIRQYKKAAGQTLLVLPWGSIEHDEPPLDAGRRELEEETGYSFGTAEVYGPFYDLPDKSTGGHWVIVARNAYRKAEPAPDDSELISGIETIPIGQIWKHTIPVLMHVGALRLAGL